MDMISSAASAVGEAMGITKAQKASLICKGDVLPDHSEPIDCMFNPTEYSLSQTVSVKRAEAPSTPGGIAEYRGTNAMTFSAKLFFDAFSQYNGDVTPTIGRLLEWTQPIKDLVDENKACPPLVGFEWGSNPQLKKFRGFLTKVNVTYQLFRHDGTPVRAEVDITIEGESVDFGPPAPSEGTGQNPTSRAFGSSKVHRVVEGESIQTVAYKRLGKPSYWRAIAELNEIDDPFRLEPGTVLLIPTAAEAAGQS
jgi:nucleoid-associated protein YgaU